MWLQLCANYAIQASAADVLLEALHRVDRALPGTLVAAVHDELLLEVDEDQVDRAARVLEEQMTEAFLRWFPQAPILDLVKIRGGVGMGRCKGLEIPAGQPPGRLTRRCHRGAGMHQKGRNMSKIASNGVNGQTGLAHLAEQVSALCELTADLLHEVDALKQMPAHNGGLDLRVSRITPDQLLDRWQAARGSKAEAFLLDRIVKRRVARRVAARNGNGVHVHD